MDKKEQRKALTPQSLSSAAKRLLLQPRVETELAERCAASDDTKHYALTLNKLEFQQWLAQAQRKPEQFPFGAKAQRLVEDVPEDSFSVALRNSTLAACSFFNCGSIELAFTTCAVCLPPPGKREEHSDIASCVLS